MCTAELHNLNLEVTIFSEYTISLTPSTLRLLTGTSLLSYRCCLIYQSYAGTFHIHQEFQLLHC